MDYSFTLVLVIQPAGKDR